MIVLVIMAIVVTVAMPSFSQTDATKLRGAGQLLSADLAFAQIDSVAHGEDPRVVVFDTVNHGYHIAVRSNPASAIKDPVTNMLYDVVFGSGRAQALGGVTISGLSVGGDDKLGFGIYGQLDQATAATITLSSGSLSLTLTVDPIEGSTTAGSIN